MQNDNNESAINNKNIRKERSKRLAKNLNLSEEETRLLIDEQLRNVGWEADTNAFKIF